MVPLSSTSIPTEPTCLPADWPSITRPYTRAVPPPDEDLTRPGAWAERYAALRDELLARIVADLGADERFPAAWLFGSFGRDEQDTYSDLDVTVLVAAEHAPTLCARPWSSAGRTTPERREIVSRFGIPLIVQEAHGNAPNGGAHTNVIYSNGTRLDLNLVPITGATRPHASLLLWDRAGVPLEPAPEPESIEERRRIVGQRMALFWVMAEEAAKYRLRGWHVAVQMMLADLQDKVETVQRLVAGDPPRFTRAGTRVPLAATPADQRDALHTLALVMEGMIPAARALGEDVQDAPWHALRLWLDAESDATIDSASPSASET